MWSANLDTQSFSQTGNEEDQSDMGIFKNVAQRVHSAIAGAFGNEKMLVVDYLNKSGCIPARRHITLSGCVGCRQHQNS